MFQENIRMFYKKNNEATNILTISVLIIFKNSTVIFQYEHIKKVCSLKRNKKTH